MKAKEYFEKYFADVESTDENPNNDLVVERGVALFKEMSAEVINILDTRHATRDSALEGALKEQNQKFNSVANMVEKKYGHPFLIRNSFLGYWKEKLGGNTHG